MKFIGNFRSYSPFNAMLVHTQMPGARFVAPAPRWVRQFRRQIKIGARPLVILQPMGPVLFVFDVSDTEALPGAPALPVWVEHPFEVRQGKIDGQLERTIETAKRDGVNISERAYGSQRAGSIQTTGYAGHLSLTGGNKPQGMLQQKQRRYELLLNSNLSREARYATLVHELGHLYCGHLGTPKPSGGRTGGDCRSKYRNLRQSRFVIWSVRALVSRTHRRNTWQHMFAIARLSHQSALMPL
jgi:hypothetical protein